jgi:hypothetical protein
VATFRSTVTSLQARIAELTAQRDALDARIDDAARRVVTGPAPTSAEPGALIGKALPELQVYATDGRPIELRMLGVGRSVVFVYPLTGRPGVDLPRGLLEVHGARGGTDQGGWLRDQHAELLAAGAARVYGLSAQSTGYQREFAHRLRPGRHALAHQATRVDFMTTPQAEPRCRPDSALTRTPGYRFSVTT